MKAQLAKPIDTLNPELLIQSNKWWVERKYDGERVMAWYLNGNCRAFNRHGVELVVPSALANWRPSIDVVLDGEIVNDVDYYVFDIVSIGETDLKREAYATRRRVLSQIEHNFPEGITLVDVATTPYDKNMMVETLRAAGEEGVMFKDTAAKYYPGKRTSRWLKMKFTKTCEVVITEFNRYDPKDKQHHQESVGFKFYDDTVDLDLSIKIPIQYQGRLNVGDVIEVRYLRAEPSGKLYQPVYVRPRPDKQANECLRSQLV